MTRMSRAALAWLIAGSASAMATGAAATGASANEAGWRLLKQGGHVALMRHALAPGTGDPANFTLDDCGTQRNLDDTGRRQAARIGDMFRKMGVAVRIVRTSQWCRCRETARLIAARLKGAAVEDFPALNSFFRDRSTAARQTDALRRYIAGLPSRGVVVLVTHQVNITALTGIFPASGEIVVLRAGQSESFRPVARIRTKY